MNIILNNIFNKCKNIKDKKLSLSQRAGKWLITFFAIMLVLTVISRATASMTVPRVKVSKIQEKAYLDFSVKGTGSLVANTETYMKIEENLRVTKTLVQCGNVVNEGDTLFIYNLDEVKQKYEKKKSDVDKAKIELDKIILGHDKQAESPSLYKPQLNNIRAEIDVGDAKSELEESKNKYNNAYKKATEKEKKQIASDISEKQTAYDKAKNNYQDVKISNKEALLAAERAVEDGKDKLQQIKKYEDKAKENDDNNKITYTEDDKDNGEKALSREEEDLDIVKKKCRVDLENAKSELEKAEKELEGAGKEPFDYESELSSVVETVDSNNKNVKETEKKLEDAKINLEDEDKKQDIEKNNTEIQSKVDSLDIENYKLQVKELEKEANHLNEIITNCGRAMAPCKGTISKMELQQGKFTTGQEAVAISFERCSLKGIISKEDAKHITIGDEINIKVNSKKEIIKATIESVGVPNSDEMVDVIAIMPEGNYLIGTEVSFEIKKNSSDKYDKCISIQGLRSDEKSKYVLVLREKDTPLGKVSIAARCDIELVDKSYLNAAISGDISKEDKVIVSSSRNIEEGDKVRVESDEEVH